MEVENNNKPEKDEEECITFVYAPVCEKVATIFLSEMKEIPSILVGNYKYFLELGDLSPIVQEVARTELRETPQIVEESLKELKTLLESEDRLRVPTHNDRFLVRFLRPCKFYPESAFILIKRYYKFKTKHQDVYADLIPSRSRRVFEENILIFQQERDQSGRRILTIKLGERWNPSKVTLDEFFQGTVLLLELGVLEPITQVCGAVIIIDFKGLTLSQTTKFTPMFIKKLLEWLQDSIPLRIKQIHIVKQPYIFKIIYRLIKMFLREKLKKRLVFHGDNMESLHNYIDPSCLPEEYGGVVKLPKIKGNPWLELLLKCDAEYQEINKYGYDMVDKSSSSV